MNKLFKRAITGIAAFATIASLTLYATAEVSSANWTASKIRQPGAPSNLGQTPTVSLTLKRYPYYGDIFSMSSLPDALLVINCNNRTMIDNDEDDVEDDGTVRYQNFPEQWDKSWCISFKKNEMISGDVTYTMTPSFTGYGSFYVTGRISY